MLCEVYPHNEKLGSLYSRNFVVIMSAAVGLHQHVCFLVTITRTTSHVDKCIQILATNTKEMMELKSMGTFNQATRWAFRSCLISVIAGTSNFTYHVEETLSPPWHKAMAVPTNIKHES